MKRNRPKQRVVGSECIERRATTMRRWRDVRMTVNLLLVGRTRQVTQDTASGMQESLVRTKFGESTKNHAKRRGFSFSFSWQDSLMIRDVFRFCLQNARIERARKTRDFLGKVFCIEKHINLCYNQ